MRASVGRGLGRGGRVAGGVLLVLLGLPSGALAQALPLGPSPAPVVEPHYFAAAVGRGTRTETGAPGASYWTNWARYRIEGRLDPKTALLEGTERIVYMNRSPVPLNALVLNLYQNLQSEGVTRNEEAQITGGIHLKRVSVAGQKITEGDLSQGPGYRVDGTVMTIRPAAAVAAGDSVTLEVDWSFTLPQSGAGRMGYSQHEVYLVAYWFPKVAAFDDLRGWDAEEYMSRAEFYEDYGSYDVSLTVPAGWTAMATGVLQNPKEVYSAQTLERLAKAAKSDERVVVATPAELKAGEVTTPGTGGMLTYRFVADSVRDFTWTTSDVQHWDATSARIPDRSGDGKENRVLIQSFWREDRAPLWEDEWRYAKQAVEFHSRYTGFPYPWPHMTAVEGADIIRGGMEFPMMTLIGPYEGRQPQNLFGVTAHEIGHMWIPMIVGSNERRHAWIDEGSTDYIELQAEKEYWPGVDYERLEAGPYLRVAAAGLEQSMMRHGDWYRPGPGYGIASYNKPATLMVALRRIMGRETWEKAYRTFISEWAYKHPTPWDFFNTFERFAGKDLDWLWTSFYYETWNVDFAVTDVETNGSGGTLVRVSNQGFAPFPLNVRIETSSGEVVHKEVPVEAWLRGKRTIELTIPASAGSVSRVVVDPDGLAPDIDRTNNFWPQG